jgi:transcriptional regulator with XRE-family HTH domain
MQGFNHHLLCLARDACGYTQSEMAKKLGIGQGTYSKYETGILSPPDESVGEIVRVLGRYPSTFFLPE